MCVCKSGLLNYLITDAENDPIGFATVVISGRLPEETLTISTVGPTLLITDTRDGLVLVSRGSRTAAEFVRVLRTLEYQNSRTT